MKSLIWKLCPTHWRHANSGLQRLRQRPDQLRQIRSSVPFASYAKLLSLYSFLKPSGSISLSTNAVSSPLSLRYETSDREVYEQVFVEEQYNFPALQNVEYIIDAGANIGLASAYLLAKYPKAKLIAIEPDPENLELARKNLRPFGQRCQLIHGAIWYRPQALAVQRSSEGHWASSVTESSDGPPELAVAGHTIDELCEQFHFPRIDLLKIDIEGAELPLFRDGDTSFLDRTGCCAVECHDEESRQAFGSACGTEQFRITEQGELSVATRLPTGSTIEGAPS